MSDREIEEREIDAAYARGFEDGLAEAIRRIEEGITHEPATPEQLGYVYQDGLGWCLPGPNYKAPRESDPYREEELKRFP